jgi:hypothetical protein
MPGNNDKPEGQFGVAAMGFSILGGLLRGMAALQAGGANAETDRSNASLADRMAGDATLRGQTAAEYALLRGSQLASRQRAAYAGAGVAAGVGTAGDVEGDTHLNARIDADTLASNAALEAWGFETQATNLRRRADLEEAAGRRQLGESILGGIQGAAGYAAKAPQIVNGGGNG